MLDFLLVLGQVPGTHIQITFYELVAACLIAAAWYFRARLLRHAASLRQRLGAYLRQKAWQRRQLSLPV